MDASFELNDSCVRDCAAVGRVSTAIEAILGAKQYLFDIILN